MQDVREEGFQMSKLVSEDYDIISVYRSSDFNQVNQQRFTRILINMVNINRKTIIFGDFNMNISCDKTSVLYKSMSISGFSQLFKEPTHIQGGIIEHYYVSKNIMVNNVKLIQKPVYYTDHDILEVYYNKL